MKRMVTTTCFTDEIFYSFLFGIFGKSIYVDLNFSSRGLRKQVISSIPGWESFQIIPENLIK